LVHYLFKIKVGLLAFMTKMTSEQLNIISSVWHKRDFDKFEPPRFISHQSTALRSSI
jgi:hypothetical protein